MRSSQYLTINVTHVFEGELLEENRFTGAMVFDASQKKSDKIVGYVAYFKLLNGFEKYLYMTEAQLVAHGKKYSKSYSSGNWTRDADSADGMKKKTVLKLLLSKFGVLSIEMQTALKSDQAVIDVDGKEEYLDNPGQVVDAEISKSDQDAMDAEIAGNTKKKEATEKAKEAEEKHREPGMKPASEIEM